MNKFIHLAAHQAHPDIWTQPFRDALSTFGELTVIEDADQIPLHERAALLRGHNIALTAWGSSALPAELANKRGNLEYICHLTGTLRQYVPLDLIDAGIPVPN